jgi:hypothetical protein
MRDSGTIEGSLVLVIVRQISSFLRLWEPLKKALGGRFYGKAKR